MFACKPFTERRMPNLIYAECLKCISSAPHERRACRGQKRAADPGTCSYRQLCATVWVPGTEPRSLCRTSKRSTSEPSRSHCVCLCFLGLQVSCLSLLSTRCTPPHSACEKRVFVFFLSKVTGCQEQRIHKSLCHLQFYAKEFKSFHLPPCKTLPRAWGPLRSQSSGPEQPACDPFPSFPCCQLPSTLAAWG